MAYSRTSRIGGSRSLSSAPRLPGGIGTDLTSKLPQTPRDERRAREERSRIENAWAAYDSLTDEFDRCLRIAYEVGHRDGRTNARPQVPTRDSIRKQLTTRRVR